MGRVREKHLGERSGEISCGVLLKPSGDWLHVVRERHVSLRCERRKSEHGITLASAMAHQRRELIHRAEVTQLASLVAADTGESATRVVAHLVQVRNAVMGGGKRAKRDRGNVLNEHRTYVD